MKPDDDDYVYSSRKLIEGIMYGLVISTFLWGILISVWLLLTT